MKYLVFTFLLIVSLVNADRCDKVEETADDSVALGTVFELEINKSVKIKEADFGIQFSEMAESRCPINTNCIRAGEAIATLNLVGESGIQDLKLEVEAYCQKDDGTCGESKSALGYKIKLLNLYPYPGSEDKGVRRAKLMVEKM
jgi:hypothetical protein